MLKLFYSMQLTVGNQLLMALILAVSLSTMCYQVISAGHSQARLTGPSIESLQDHGTYIIHFKDYVSDKELRHFITALVGKSILEQNFTVEIIEKMLIIKCLTARLSRRALNWVTHHKAVLTVKEDEYIMVGSGQAFDPPFDPSSGMSAYWHLDRLDQESLPLDETFTVNLTGENVDVYVLDSGIHYEHEEFDGRALYPGCDPIDKLYHQNQTGRDCEGHGTHVAGLVGGNSTGVANGVTLFSVRILTHQLQATEASLIQGLVCVVNHRQTRNGTRAIINLSIAGLHTTKGINKALQLALDNDIIITASAGSGGAGPFRSINYNSCKVYPASYPGVINVGAIDMYDNALMGEFDSKTYITNMGGCLDVFAPGYNILSSDVCSSTTPCHSDNDECITGMICDDTCRKYRSGTSQSSSLVAGAIALLLEKCPELTNAEIKYALKHSLSISKVKFNKAIKYATINKSGILHTVLATLSNNRLLYIGNDLENVPDCSIHHKHS